MVDLHVYGGLVLVAIGGEIVYSGAGVASAGVILLWIGVRG
jgi:hypothetical protein